MKKITININPYHKADSFVKIEKMYSFHLPNKAKVVFSNKRSFEKFISDSERLFTDLVYEWNELLILLYSEYRIWYFNISNEMENTFENDFNEIRRLMTRSFKNHVFKDNGIAYLYNDFKLIIKILNKIVNNLEKMAKSLNIYSKTKKYKIIKNRLNANQLQLKNWGWKHHKPWGKFKEFNISYYENQFFKAYSIDRIKD